MGGTSTQGLGVCVFLVGFTVLAAGIATGGGAMVLSLVGAGIVLVSFGILKKAKAAEGEE